MKKLLSVVLALMLVLTALPTFAADSAIGATEFVNGTEYEYNLKTVGESAYKIGASSSSVCKYTGEANKGAMVAFKLPLPELAQGQEFANYTFRFADSAENTNRSAYFRVVKLGGIDWDSVKAGTMTTTTEPVKTAITLNDKTAPESALTQDTALEAVQCTERTNYYYKADITAYANECLENGDDAIYVGVFSLYSYGVYGFGDSSLTTEDERIPYAYFTTQKKQVFEHTIEGYRWVGNKTNVTESYKVSAGVPSEAAGNVASSYISGNGNFAIYKITLPAVAEGEGYKHFILSFGAGHSGSIFKMPGENWDLTKTLADTDWYKAIIVASTAQAYKANDADVLVEETAYYKNTLADITTYANECLSAGQTHMYLAVGVWNSTSNVALSTMTDSSYVAAGNKPCYYYMTGEVAAEPEPEEPEVPFEHTIAGYQGVSEPSNLTAGFESVAGVVSEDSGSWASGKVKGGNFAIYQISLPQIPEGKEIEHFIIRWGQSGTTGGMVIRKMPGDDWVLPGNISDTDWYKAIINEATSPDYAANDEAILTENVGYNEETGKYSGTVNYADITSYAKDCVLAGQQYMYLATAIWNSTVNIANPCMTDSSYVSVGLKPAYYCSFVDTKPIEFDSSSVEDGGFVGDVEAGVDFMFTSKIESATATINDEAAEVEFAGGIVTVKNLNKNIANVIEVIATDASGNEATASITVNGYGKANLTRSTYVVNSAGSTASTYNPSASYVASVIFRIPLPEVADGKEIENFTFNFITPNALGNLFHLVKLPGEDWEVANLVQTDGEVAEGLTNIWSFTQDPVSYKYVNKATRAKITSERVDIAPSAKNDDGKSYMNHANLSQYARECIARGQSTMWLAVRSNSTVAITGVGDSSHAGAGRIHTVTWTIKEKDAAIAAPKAVLATEEVSYDEASATTLLEKETEYKFITKANVVGKLVVAQYDANKKLVSIDAADLDGTGADVAAAFTTGAEEGFVKVFVWAADKMAPTDDDITVLAVK